MRRDPRAYLWDVHEAALAIQTFVSGFDASAYIASELVQAAVERKFEIIGEALNQLTKVAPSLTVRVPNAAQIVAFRNQLIHGYAVINHSTVWNVVQNELPALLESVQMLIEESSDS